MLQMGHADIPWYIPGIPRSFTAFFRCHFECTSPPPGVQVGAIRQQILAQEQQQRDPLDQQRAGPMDVAGQKRQHLVVGQGEGAKGLQRNGGKLKKPIQYIIWNLWVDGCNLKIRFSSKRHHPFWGVLPEGLQSPPFSWRVPAHLHLCVNEIIASEGIARELVQLRLRKPLGWCCKKPRFGTSTRKNRSDLNYTQTGGRIGGNFNSFYHEYQGLWATS